jgi:hypothetical protein
MLKLFRSSCVQGAFFGLFAVLTVSSAQAQVTALDRQLERVDVAVSGMAVFTKGVSGTNSLDEVNYGSPDVTLNASSTVGALVQARYTKSPFMGLEFNYSYARFTENFSVPPNGVQTNASEYTIGYVAHLPSILGFQPFASAGAGATAFKPTPLGGQSLPERARASYYYDIGLDDQLTRFIGVRAQFRQVFYKAPDFGQNYLTINQQTFTTEPSVGVYIKF